jgi:hypothetical protein
MDILAMGLAEEARRDAPQGQSTKRLRRTKLLAAFALTALVGVGSYTATYRALEIISIPSSPASSVTPIPSAATTTVPPPS